MRYALLACSLSLALLSDATAQHREVTYKQVYEGSDELPSGASFKSIVQITDYLFNEEGEAQAIQYVMHEMSLPRDQAVEILEMLLSMAEALPIETNRVHYNAQCNPDDTPKAVGVEYAPIHDGLDFATWAMLDRLYASFLDNLSKQTQRDALEMWVQVRKKNIHSYSIDYVEQARRYPQWYEREFDEKYLGDQCASLRLTFE